MPARFLQKDRAKAREDEQARNCFFDHLAWLKGETINGPAGGRHRRCQQELES
jgi:hypothetical protein